MSEQPEKQAFERSVGIDDVEELVGWAKEKGLSEDEFMNLVFTTCGVLADHLLDGEGSDTSFGMILRHRNMAQPIRMTCEHMTVAELEFHLHQRNKQTQTEH